MATASAKPFDAPRLRSLLRAPLPRSYTDFIGRQLFVLLLTLQGVGAFALITLGVMIRKMRTAPAVTFPAIRNELVRSGLRLLPMFLFLSFALGLVVIGQTVSFASRVNATDYLGKVMVFVVVRELGPMLTALIVLTRSGMANVIELGTARALGEIESLEALGIDPVHYLVMPRVIGMALGVFSLTIYFIIGALLSGYLWAFLQDIPLRPGDYFGQIARALNWMDFMVLAVKSALFGAIIAVFTCYHGLAQPLQLGEVSKAAMRAVAQSIIICMLLDALFIILYLTL